MRTKSLLLTIAATLGMTALTMAQNVPSYVPTNGLVGWWPFNGNANDESGNGNNGVVNGATLTNDRFGNALNAFNFDGNQNRIEVPLDSALNGNTTISVWYYSLSLNGGPFVHIGQDNPGSQYCDGYDIGKGGTTLNNQGNDLISGFSCIGYYDSEIPTLNAQWNNAVLIKTANQIQIFLNGSLVYTQTTTNPINPSPFLYFASTSPVVSTLFEGTLDDIGVWSRALTQQEITDLYNGNICFQTITVTDTLLINMGIVSYNPITYDNTIKIFPNPSNDHITINYGNFASMNGYQLKIINSLSQQVYQTNITQQSDYLNLTTWGGNGLYFVQIIDPLGNIIDIRKIVLQ